MKIIKLEDIYILTTKKVDVMFDEARVNDCGTVELLKKDILVAFINNSLKYNFIKLFTNIGGVML